MHDTPLRFGAVWQNQTVARVGNVEIDPLNEDRRREIHRRRGGVGQHRRAGGNYRKYRTVNGIHLGL